MTSSIAVATRMLNKELYDISMSFLKDLDYNKIPVRNKTAEQYLIYILNLNYDIVINIDEDCFVFKPEYLIELIEEFLKSPSVMAGMRDGGVVKVRHHNPVVLNPFFNLFKNTEIKKEVIDSTILKSSFKQEFKKFVPISLTGDYVFDNFEPYYPIYYGLLDKFGMPYYLDARTHVDDISTIIKDHKGRDFAIHTWFSRNRDHRKRILRAIEYVKNNLTKSI